MTEGEVNPHPIQILSNYWEIKPALMGKALDELIRHGVNHIATFVPWQAVESDISHTLSRFIQALAERRMTASLILSPEVGIHYANSGIPKDVLSKTENMAQHHGGGPVVVSSAPNGFRLPSLFAPEFTKRYYNYLSRLDGLFADLSRTQSKCMESVQVILSGSFWKYYRSPRDSSLNAFGGQSGDYSDSAKLAYRQRLDQFFAQREFADPGPLAANRWKSQEFDEFNRRWFYQQSEDVFRSRSFQLIRKKAFSLNVRQIELYTPEADPGYFYSQFLQMVSGGNGDFFRLSNLVDEALARRGGSAGAEASSFVHWSCLGGFHSLADSEKQFLILKSLLLAGSQRGGVFIDRNEWFSLSLGFRSRAEAFARWLAHGELKLKNRVVYLTSHLWSTGGLLWDELFARVGSGARMVSSLEVVVRDPDANLVVVDPTMIITRDLIVKLSSWIKAGRIAVLPKNSLYSEAARAELDLVSANARSLEIDLGVPYRLHAVGEGKLILYDTPEAIPLKAEFRPAWQTFLTAVLSIAEVDNYCRLSDPRLVVIPVEKKSGLGLFVLNGTRKKLGAEIVFPKKVRVTDLAMSVSAFSVNSAGNSSSEGIGSVELSSQYSLDVPACGILSLSVGSPKESQKGDAAALAAASSRFPAREREEMNEVWK